MINMSELNSTMLYVTTYPDCEIFSIRGALYTNRLLSEVPSLIAGDGVLPPLWRNPDPKSNWQPRHASLGYGVKNGEEIHWFYTLFYETIIGALRKLYNVMLVIRAARDDSDVPLYCNGEWSIPGNQEAALQDGYSYCEPDYHFISSKYTPPVNEVSNGWRTHYPIF